MKKSCKNKPAATPSTEAKANSPGDFFKTSRCTKNPTLLFSGRFEHYQWVFISDPQTKLTVDEYGVVAVLPDCYMGIDADYDTLALEREMKRRKAKEKRLENKKSAA